MQDHRLVLYPSDMSVKVDTASLQQALRDSGLLGEEHDWQGERHFLPGEQFLDSVIFLGCSPFINLVPPQNDAQGSEYCHIWLAPSSDVPVFLGGENVRIPRCPHCRQPLENWREGLAHDNSVHCPACAEVLNLVELNWRRSAAFACSAVHIWGIHDGEAVPSERLMNMLAGLTGCKWGYFYRQSR